jgi:HSP20 family protein
MMNHYFIHLAGAFLPAVFVSAGGVGLLLIINEKIGGMVMWTRVSELDRMYGVMDLLRSRMDRLFTDYDRGYGEDYGWRVADAAPRTNLYDTGDQFEVKAEIPGLSKDDLKIMIQGNYLELSGTRKAETPEGYKVHRVERGNATFTRSFTLPSDVEVEKVEARLENGILNLTLPKAEAAKPKQISIK